MYFLYSRVAHIGPILSGVLPARARKSVDSTDKLQLLFFDLSVEKSPQIFHAALA